PRHRDRDPHHVLARRPGNAPGGGGDRRRFRAGGRRPGMPEQGPGVARGSGRRPAPAAPRLMSLPTSFVADVDRDLVVVRGPDATSFLQSLLSQDLDDVAVGGSVHTLLLQPQGKLLVDLYARRVADDEWWCVCEGGFGGELAE